MKNFKIKLNIIFILFAFFSAENVFAQDSLFVEFQNNPLFSETNFVPSESVEKYIRVTNNSGNIQTIVVSTINSISCNANPCLSEAINLVIKKGENKLYDDTLKNFLKGDYINLGDLDNGASAQYDFIATFKPEKGNEYQSLSTGFDLLVGFLGGVFVDSGNTSVGVGGGGNGPPGLTIKDEVSILLNIDSVEIQWMTSFPATSQVIYREEGQSYSLDLSLPNYGYPYGTVENFSKTLNHSILLFGLESGKTYYYRVVSHASPATVGIEHNFKIPTETEIEREIGFFAYDSKIDENSLIKLADGGMIILPEDKSDDSTTTPVSLNTSTSNNSDNLALASGVFLGLSLWVWLLILLIILIIGYLFLRND
ncbi:hypothetical protein A3I18_00500 [Candidatus Campbellbacteria bacterium RIFCSPLOWO2_02_FULL_35_11]|uniref:Purple acid phosphatase N-terminal domain-containing protein n=2 Tax=Candidatus Campbelliibacteriota TaxID=1752727 RepID=A0A1F5EKR0_9BACT|nr:MAG: hypothetical protein A3E89_00570 [Candidatus Campbellbacteria bacterium RIFCSPHIGHO2_12_FULL_35_10]OGD70478.1 MAG: hypothetical protein A3I18_00500 [Candidatus Campbellbacteria bacterium RIFCSPLOWO2_02_FULL_35_11]